MKQKQLLSFLVCILMLSSCAAPTDSAHDSGLPLRVYFANAEEIRLLPLEDYVFGALAAEMPAIARRTLNAERFRPDACRRAEPRIRRKRVRPPPRLRMSHGQRVLSGIPDGCAAASPLGQRVRRPPRALTARSAQQTACCSPAAACPSRCCTTPVPAERLKMPLPCSRPPSRIWSALDSPGEEGYAGFRADTSFTCEEAAACFCTLFPLRRDGGHAAQRDSSAIHDRFRARRDAAGRQSDRPRR